MGAASSTDCTYRQEADGDISESNADVVQSRQNQPSDKRQQKRQDDGRTSNAACALRQYASFHDVINVSHLMCIPESRTYIYFIGVKTAEQTENRTLRISCYWREKVHEFFVCEGVILSDSAYRLFPSIFIYSVSIRAHAKSKTFGLLRHFPTDPHQIWRTYRTR